ncbi:MAG: type III pantothenate kinase [Endomicrobiales bacterium]|nr:type III pantothenate kinase [Endomicrobiales bacterium]
MLLAIDIGNTNITLGIFRFDSGKPVRRPVSVWRLGTDQSRTSDEYGTKILDLFHYALLEANEVKAVAIASVVPKFDSVFEELSIKYFKKNPFFITGAGKIPLKILYDNPGEVGADRIANAVAAYDLYKSPVVVIDFGTATTFDCISKRQEYLGGVIVPGPVIAQESLARRTAKLPKVDILRPKKAIGKSTVTSIQSGLFYGYLGLIKEVLKRVSVEIPGRPRVIATGGLAELYTRNIKEVKAVIPELTLEGIRIIWEKNREV